MIKLLIGGSPCTYWSIAQTQHRETEASGMGWELFKNFLVAREKYQPDYFLYENNKSMSAAIKTQITKETGVDPVMINSATVSAQNRQRFYWVGSRPNNEALHHRPSDAAGGSGNPPSGYPGDRHCVERKIVYA